MAFAIASSSLFLASRARFARFFAVSAALALAGCVGNSAFDDLNATQPVGSAFSVALFKDYSYLAHSFGTDSEPSGQAFDAGQSISLTDTDNTISGLVGAYAEKALAAGKGDEILPEAAPDGDMDAENVRLELLRDLDEGRDKAPEDAARAQADFDCWIMDRRVDTLAAAAATCRRSVTASLARLERDLNPAPTPSTPAPAPSTPEFAATTPAPSTPESAATTPAPSIPESAATTPAPAPTTPAPSAAAQPVEFTVTFGFRSATIPPEQFTTIAQAIATARAGRQTRITVVGHCDTAENSQRLSLRRAQAVKDALVMQGARADAIEATGVGKDDLAVQTEDHVKELKNRRVVISLLP